MSLALEDITREALHLPSHQRLALASFLLELDGPSSDAKLDQVWEHEISTRIKHIDQGSATAIPLDQVFLDAEALLASR